MKYTILNNIEKIVESINNNNFKSLYFEKDKFHFIDKDKHINFQATLGNYHNLCFKDLVNKQTYISTRKAIAEGTYIQQIIIESKQENYYISFFRRDRDIGLIKMITVNEHGYVVCENPDFISRMNDNVDLLEYIDRFFEEEYLEYEEEEEFLEYLDNNELSEQKSMLDVNNDLEQDVEYDIELEYESEIYINYLGNVAFIGEFANKFETTRSVELDRKDKDSAYMKEDKNSACMEIDEEDKNSECIEIDEEDKNSECIEIAEEDKDSACIEIYEEDKDSACIEIDEEDKDNAYIEMDEKDNESTYLNENEENQDCAYMGLYKGDKDSEYLEVDDYDDSLEYDEEYDELYGEDSDNEYMELDEDDEDIFENEFRVIKNGKEVEGTEKIKTISRCAIEMSKSFFDSTEIELLADTLKQTLNDIEKNIEQER